jgi:fructoselysine-6-P-deglycase FrlB-like protein
VYLTEKEIFGQYKALKETYQYFLDQKQVIQDFKNKTHFKSMTYIGCGSGYCLCQSGEISAKLRMESCKSSGTNFIKIIISNYTIIQCNAASRIKEEKK